MKKIIILFLLVAATGYTQAQSNSYLTMKDTFKGGHDVFHITVSGFLCRTVLTWADEHEFRDAITDVKNVRFITVPKSEFTQRDLTVNGFKRVLKQDAFEELAHFQDHGDYVTVFLQENGKHKDRYFILIDEGTEVIAVELKGTVDVNKLLSLQNQVAMND